VLGVTLKVRAEHSGDPEATENRSGHWAWAA
jgi:hypothetical protein